MKLLRGLYNCYALTKYCIGYNLHNMIFKYD